MRPNITSHIYETTTISRLVDHRGNDVMIHVDVAPTVFVTPVGAININGHVAQTY